MLDCLEGYFRHWSMELMVCEAYQSDGICQLFGDASFRVVWVVPLAFIFPALYGRGWVGPPPLSRLRLASSALRRGSLTSNYPRGQEHPALSVAVIVCAALPGSIRHLGQRRRNVGQESW